MNNLQDYLIKFINDVLIEFQSDFLGYFMGVFTGFLTLYLLIMLIKAAVDQRDIKEPAKVLLRVGFFGAIVTSGYHLDWFLQPLSTTRDNFIKLVLGNYDSVFEATIMAINQGKLIMEDNAGWGGEITATVYGFILMLAYLLVYALYLSIYMAAYFGYAMLMLFSGIILLLSTMTIFGGLVKVWFKALFSHSFTMFFVSLLMIMSSRMSAFFITDVSQTQAGSAYFMGLVVPILTFYFLPKASSFGNDLLGGTLSDFNAEAQNISQTVKAAGGALKYFNPYNRK